MEEIILKYQEIKEVEKNRSELWFADSVANKTYIDKLKNDLKSLYKELSQLAKDLKFNDQDLNKIENKKEFLQAYIYGLNYSPETGKSDGINKTELYSIKDVAAKLGADICYENYQQKPEEKLGKDFHLLTIKSIFNDGNGFSIITPYSGNEAEVAEEFLMPFKPREVSEFTKKIIDAINNER